MESQNGGTVSQNGPIMSNIYVVPPPIKIYLIVLAKVIEIACDCVKDFYAEAKLPSPKQSSEYRVAFV